MAGRRLTYDEWLAEQIASDPSFGREVARTQPSLGRKRKVDLLVDENLEGLVEDLRGMRDFRVHVEGRRRSDEYLWRTSIRKKWLLVTRDVDFWDETTYPLRLSQGVVILRGRTLDDFSRALAGFCVHWGLVSAVGKFGIDIMDGFKAKASRSSIEWIKSFGDGDVIHDRITLQRPGVG